MTINIDRGPCVLACITAASERAACHRRRAGRRTLRPTSAARSGVTSVTAACECAVYVTTGHGPARCCGALSVCLDRGVAETLVVVACGCGGARVPGGAVPLGAGASPAVGAGRAR